MFCWLWGWDRHSENETRWACLKDIFPQSELCLFSSYEVKSCEIRERGYAFRNTGSVWVFCPGLGSVVMATQCVSLCHQCQTAASERRRFNWRLPFFFVESTDRWWYFPPSPSPLISLSLIWFRLTLFDWPLYLNCCLTACLLFLVSQPESVTSSLSYSAVSLTHTQSHLLVSVAEVSMAT